MVIDIMVLRIFFLLSLFHYLYFLFFHPKFVIYNTIILGHGYLIPLWVFYINNYRNFLLTLEIYVNLPKWNNIIS